MNGLPRPPKRRNGKHLINYKEVIRSNNAKFDAISTIRPPSNRRRSVCETPNRSAMRDGSGRYVNERARIQALFRSLIGEILLVYTCFRQDPEALLRVLMETRTSAICYKILWGNGGLPYAKYRL